MSNIVIAILVVLLVLLLLAVFLRPVNKEKLTEVELPIYSKNGKLSLDYVTGTKYTLPLVTDDKDKLYSLYSQDQSLLKNHQVIPKIDDKCNIFKLYIASTCGIARLIIMNSDAVVAWSSHYFPSDDLDLSLNETTMSLTVTTENFTHDFPLIAW
jgi:hypothetical protein